MRDEEAMVPSFLVAVMLLAGAAIAEAQQPKKVFRVGILENVSSPRTDAFLSLIHI